MSFKWWTWLGGGKASTSDDDTPVEIPPLLLPSVEDVKAPLTYEEECIARLEERFGACKKETVKALLCHIGNPVLMMNLNIVLRDDFSAALTALDSREALKGISAWCRALRDYITVAEKMQNILRKEPWTANASPSAGLVEDLSSYLMRQHLQYQAPEPLSFTLAPQRSASSMVDSHQFSQKRTFGQAAPAASSATDVALALADLPPPQLPPRKKEMTLDPRPLTMNGFHLPSSEDQSRHH